MKTVVINLPEREDRLESMRIQFGDFEVEDGIRHAMPHTGCGLAHINAMRRGLRNSDTCLILEDDCTLMTSFENFSKTVEDLAKEDFDVCVLNPNHDNLHGRPIEEELSVFKSGPLLQVSPTNRLVSTHAYIAKKSLLPLLDEYERVIKEGTVFLPLDRLFLTNNWNPEILTTFEKCLGIKKPPYVSWNVPRTKIYIERDIIRVSNTFISDHTGEPFCHEWKETQILYDYLKSRESEGCAREPRTLDIVYDIE